MGAVCDPNSHTGVARDEASYAPLLVCAQGSLEDGHGVRLAFLDRRDPMVEKQSTALVGRPLLRRFSPVQISTAIAGTGALGCLAFFARLPSVPQLRTFMALGVAAVLVSAFRLRRPSSFRSKPTAIIVVHFLSLLE